MNIKTKLTLNIGMLVAMIVLLVSLSVVNLQILTATEPTSPAAGPGLQRALIWVSIIGGICIVCGLWMLKQLPASINKPVKEITDGIKEIANHNYEQRLNLESKEFEEVSNAMTILFINDEALSILNLQREEVLWKSAQEIALRNDLLRRLLRGVQDSFDEKNTAKNEPLKIYADNKESYFQMKCMKTGREGTSQKEGYVILLKNITEFKELDSAKTTFISTISHELKTPISAILMSLQLLEDSRVGFLNEEQKELAQSIQDNSDRLLNITSELLNMTQVESGKLQLKPRVTKPIELIEYAIKANRIQAEKFNIQIEVQYPEEKIGKLFVDSEKIAWVLTNLLSNAIRYSAENGRIIIGARKTEDNWIEMFVRDFGKGIDPRYHQSIFDHYFRVPGTKVQGSGLGLSISKDFVEAHGGTLTVESEIGKGSCFTLRLKA